MSNVAVNWVKQLVVGKATAKYVLRELADTARDTTHVSRATGKSWPPLHAYLSIGAIEQITELNRKTVIASLKYLQDKGLIRHAGTDGQSNQVQAYELLVTSTKNGTGKDTDDTPVTSTKNGTRTSPKNGTSTKNGPVPIFPVTSTVFSADQYHFFPPPVPKTGHETIGNPEEPNITLNTEGASPPPKLVKGSRLSPDWELPMAWQAWAVAERPDLDIPKVAEIFRDHWKAQSGSKAVKANWESTWKNWVRREGAGSKRNTSSRVTTRQSGFDRFDYRKGINENGSIKHS